MNISKRGDHLFAAGLWKAIGDVEFVRHVGRRDRDRAFPAARVLPGLPGRSAARGAAGKQSARDSAAAGRQGGVRVLNVTG